MPFRKYKVYQRKDGLWCAWSSGRYNHEKQLSSAFYLTSHSKDSVIELAKEALEAFRRLKKG